MLLINIVIIEILHVYFSTVETNVYYSLIAVILSEYCDGIKVHEV